MKRYLEKHVKKDLQKKMVLISGPRQCGKTTFAKSLLQKSDTYLSWDDPIDQETILNYQWPSRSSMLVLDEIHKYKRWRNLVKGLFDKRKDDLRILVTGSAKLDHYRKGGDSLQGRYFHFRMHPLTFNEIGQTRDVLENLLRYGSFPEPFLGKSTDQSLRWSKNYRFRLIRDEVASLENIKDISLIEAMTHRLPITVSSTLSINSLREDLGVAHASVEHWIKILESLFLVFRIHPFSGNILQSLKKEPKLYFFDYLNVQNESARFENLIALHLLKECHLKEDLSGDEYRLAYYRDKSKREVDFVIVKNQNPVEMIECKWNEKDVSPSLKYLKQKFPNCKATQVLWAPKIDFTNQYDIRVCSADIFLKEREV